MGEVALKNIAVLACVCACAHARERLSPEGTEAHTANHVEKRVKYEQTQQQVEEHGLWG